MRPPASPTPEFDRCFFHHRKLPGFWYAGGMAEAPEPTRRMTSFVFLGIALLMLILGLTVLAPFLNGTVFIGYWLACTCFTLSAATVALIEMSAVRRRAIREQRDLIEKTLAEIEHESAERKRNDRKNPPPGV